MYKALTNLINKWAYRCEHDFKLLKEVDVYFTERDEIPYKTKFIFFCKKCGKCKKFIS